MKELIELLTSDEALFTYHVFGQVIAWFVTIFATSMLVIYWGFRHTWALLNVVWDHYIRKLNPEVVVNRGLVTSWGHIYNEKSPVDFLKDRIRSLKKENKRKLERVILQHIVDDMGEIKYKLTGKNKNKIRGKGYQVSKGVKRKVRV